MKNNQYTELDFHLSELSREKAIELLEWKINEWKGDNFHCVTLIHGYGSHGQGGVIRESVRRYLTRNREKLKIKTLIQGEEFEMFNEASRSLRHRYEELKAYYGKGNNGVTIIEI